MGEVSILTERDLELVALGKWPIDVSEPRRLNAIEEAELVAKPHRTPDRSRFEPCVCKGYLYWREVLPGAQV